MGERSEDDGRVPEPPEGLLTAPENSVLESLDTPDEVSALCGPKGAERAKHGLPGRAYLVPERR